MQAAYGTLGFAVLLFISKSHNGETLVALCHNFSFIAVVNLLSFSKVSVLTGLILTRHDCIETPRSYHLPHLLNFVIYHSSS